MSESDRQQIQDYMAKHGINELLYELLEGICLDMPDNPHQFIVDYMQEHFPDKVRVAGGGAPPISIDEEDEEDGEEEEEEEDQMGATPASFRQSEMSDSFRKRVPNHARRRTGVSAEVMSPGILRREGYTPVVHEKPAEVRTALQDILGENILFKDLDAAQMTTLLDAMFEATFSAGEVIIEQGAEGDNFYVVFKGECEVFVAKSEGQEAEQAPAAPNPRPTRGPALTRRSIRLAPPPAPVVPVVGPHCAPALTHDVTAPPRCTRTAWAAPSASWRSCTTRRAPRRSRRRRTRRSSLSTAPPSSSS